MDTKAMQVGDKVRALCDRIFQYRDQSFVIWREGQILQIQGIVQHENYREFLINLDHGPDWENVPEPLMQEFFISP